MIRKAFVVTRQRSIRPRLWRRLTFCVFSKIGEGESEGRIEENDNYNDLSDDVDAYPSSSEQKTTRWTRAALRRSV